MSEAIEAALQLVATGEHDAALERLRDVEVGVAEAGRPTREALLTVALARCQISVANAEHRGLLTSSLEQIAALTDVESDAEVGPLWYYFSAEAAMLFHRERVGPWIDAFVAHVSRLGVVRSTLHLVAALLEELLEREQPEASSALEALVRAALPNEGAALVGAHADDLARLAPLFRRLGHVDIARRICEALSRAAGPAHRAAGMMTLGIIEATAGRFGAARVRLDDALAQAEAHGLRGLAETIRFNAIATHYHAGEPVELARRVRDLMAGPHRPPIDVALSLARMLRRLDGDLAAFDLLSTYADHDSMADDREMHVRWLEAFAGTLAALSDDFCSAELCERVVGLDDRLARVTTSQLGDEDYERIGRAYEHLVRLYTELDRYDGDLRDRALSYLEAAKEAAFSRALPTVQEKTLPSDIVEELHALTGELAALEALVESSVRGGRAIEQAPLRDIAGPVRERMLASSYEREVEREQRIASIRNRLRDIRATCAGRLSHFSSFVGVDAATFARMMFGARWPESAIALSYRIDREEMELCIYVVQLDGTIDKHVSEVNPVALDAILSVLALYPETEMDYIVERLTELLVPNAVDVIMRDSKATTVLISGDPALLSVPWEALGRGDDRLGLRFSVCRSPSLIRTAAQVMDDSRKAVGIRRALVVADPSGDLPWAAHEGERVAGALRAAGIATTEVSRCSVAEFLEGLREHELIHFAGHTNYLREDPASSYLLFSDGRLTTSALAGATIEAGAVFVLSSCESAQASQESPHGSTLGIGAAFLLKGASAVVATNWVADDRVSSTIAGSLYASLISGRETIAASLRRVRQELFDEGRPVWEWALPSVLGHPFVTLQAGART